MWALAVGIPQGEGLIGQHGKEGLSWVTDIALRPVLLVGMFALSLGLYYLTADGLILLVSQTSSQIHFSFEIIHTGPYWAMRVLGIDGGQRREGREGQEIR